VAFEPVEQHPDLPAVEERVLERWRARKVFQRSLERTGDGPLFRFYEGPPTANGRPGVHHVAARVFKDLFPRYRSMKGEYTPRKGGWDCHGIPVELEVERELGITRKPQIEEYGVAEFNARCRESVTRYVDEFQRLTERIGYWVDTDDAYWTMSTEYVESVWWSLRTLFDKGLIYQDYRVVPYCPRCGTALSDHEVAQGYEETEDPSVYVRFPILTGPLAPGGAGVSGDPAGASLLVWTTMPWTLVPATAAVVSDSIRYVLARGGRAGDHLVVLAADLVPSALGEGAQVVREVTLAELAGARYRAPFDLVGPGSPADPDGDPASWRYVVVDDFVKAEEGTGVVHTGAAFGEDDLRVARAAGMPVINPVDAEGRFDQRVGPYAGMWVRDADARIIEDLRSAGLLAGVGTHRHAYPFCWRCHTPLLYYAKPSWYIATTRFRDTMLADNAKVDWRPPHIRDGRYGDWLEHNVDWALSRERYWGTPLPIWRCGGCQHAVAIGSRAELGERVGADLSGLDPHRPFVDEVTFGCPECGGEMRRVPEVIDAWYDSGSMPFAQFGYPHVPGGADRFAAMFPADFICEGIDQTRGWFYSLQAVATPLFGRSSYTRSLVLGLLVDAEGRKMSKSSGNVLDPFELVDRHGADALRWLLVVEGNPWQSRRVGDGPLAEITRKLLLTLWNTYYFLVTYARLAGWTPERGGPPTAARPVLDRWVLAELAEVTAEADGALADFDATRAGRRVADFVEDLSNWYVRCSRSRFWSTDPDADPADADAAFTTLHTCLTTVAGLLAPFTPFLADELHENLVRTVIAGAPDSVHLTDFPAPRPDERDARLLAAMATARQLVTLGRDARAGAGVATRQPLRRAVVTVPAEQRDLLPDVHDVIAGELNVKTVELASTADAGLVTFKLKPNFRALGPAFGGRTAAVAAAIERADADAAVAALGSAGRFELDVAGERVTVTAEQVRVIEEHVTGWEVSTSGPYSVALDLRIDPALRREGLARELIRALNEQRKQRGLRLDDRIALRLTVLEDPDGALAATLAEHGATIAREVLAIELDVATARGADRPSGARLDIAGGTLVADLTVTPA
jgi:isoleucyl-tRNA synthetase